MTARGGTRGTDNSHSKGGKRGKPTSLACVSEISSVDFESEEESDPIIDVRKIKGEQRVTRSVGMGTQNTQRE